MKDRQVACGEVFLSAADYQQIIIRRGQVTDTKTSLNKGYSVRVVEAGKAGFAYSTDLSNAGINRTIDHAQKVLPYGDSEAANMLPTRKIQPWQKSLHNFDRRIKDLTVADLINFAGDIEEAAGRVHKSIKDPESVGISAGTEETYLVSTHIPLLKETFSYIGGNANCIGDDGRQRAAASYMGYACDLDDFQPATIGSETARRASVLLGATTITSGRREIVLDPYVSCQFLGFMAPLFSAENGFKAKSPLTGKLGQSMASPILTIVDDGLMPGRIASSYYDAEGVPTRKTVVVDKGTFQSYLYNTGYALKLGAESTGNASRVSYKTPPAISPSNLYILPGKTDKNGLVKLIDHGLYVLNVMGMHTANPVSGDFSLGVQGILIEKGELTKPVKGITLTGNLIDFLNNISSIADDPQFFLLNAHIGAPTIHVSDVMVGG